MTKLKLSQLDDDVQIASEYGLRNYTVAEIRNEIIKHREPHHETDNWYIVNPAKWEPDAKTMLERYIEMEADELYEDWEDGAWNCLTKETIQEIQSILDESLGRDEYVTNYWNFDFSKPVEIDIKPFNLG